MPEMAEDALFISAFTFTPSYVGPMWDRIGHDSSSDFAYGKDVKAGINIGERVAQDANHAILLQTLAVVVGNEDTYAWVLLNEATKAGNPHYDEFGTSDICDADKGAAGAFVQVFETAHQKIDQLHRRDTISKTASANGGGTVGAEHYKKAFRSRSLLELEKTKSEMPTKTAELLGKVPDSKQYPVAAPWGIAGAHSSSPSESWNHAALAARKLTLVAAAKSLLESDSERFMRNKAAALGCEATLPPRVNEAQLGQKLSASRISRSHVTFLDNTKSVAMVSSLV